MQQTRIPVLVGLLQVGLNLGLGWLCLVLGYGVGMLALAFSIANTVEAVLLALLLRRQFPGIWREVALLRSLRAAVFGALILAVCFGGLRWLSLPLLPFLSYSGAYDWRSDMLPLLLWLLLVGSTGTLMYLGVTTILGAQEARILWQRLRRALPGQ
jgi:putative peptidoglycan lipid II flippase